MNFLDYQAKTKETAIYPCGTTIEALSYLGLGLGEAGEVQGKIKKILRDNGGAVTLSKKIEIIEELGDLLWYISQMASELGFNLEAVAKRNVDKLADRAGRGVLQGSGDDR